LPQPSLPVRPLLLPRLPERLLWGEQLAAKLLDMPLPLER
jgi:hypothetical protein